MKPLGTFSTNQPLEASAEFRVGVRSVPYLADHGFQDMVVLSGPKLGREAFAERAWILADGTIEVVSTRLDLERDAVGALAEFLTEDERQRASRFRFLRDRERFTVGRAQLRELTNSQAVRERCRELARRIAVTDSVAATCKIIEDAIHRN